MLADAQQVQRVSDGLAAAANKLPRACAENVNADSSAQSIAFVKSGRKLGVASHCDLIPERCRSRWMWADAERPMYRLTVAGIALAADYDSQLPAKSSHSLPTLCTSSYPMRFEMCASLLSQRIMPERPPIGVWVTVAGILTI